MRQFLGRAVPIVFVSLLFFACLMPATATAQGDPANVIKVTICDAPDIEGCADKTKNNRPFRMIFDPEVLEIECVEVDGDCTNDDSEVAWEVTNKQDDHDADVKFAGSGSKNRRAFTEQRIRKGKKRSVSEKPRNLKFENGEARWRYELIILDENGRTYARKDPEIIIRKRG